MEEEYEQAVKINEEDQQVNNPTYEEIIEIINKLKNGKSPGKDGLNVVLLKYGREMLHDKIYIT